MRKSPLRPDQVLFYLHIPKTGGVSLYEIIDSNFAPEEILPVPNHEKVKNAFRELSPTQLAAIRYVRGHFWFGRGDQAIYDFLVPDPVTITLLRNPIDRTVSVFQFVTSNPHIWLAKRVMRPGARLTEIARHPIEEGEIRALQSMNLKDFVRNPAVQNEIRNLQARLVVGQVPGNPHANGRGEYEQEGRMPDDELLELAKRRLDGFAFVGLTERFEESVVALTSRFGWPPVHHIPRLNASEEPSQRYQVPPDAREAILERTDVDAALYEHARRLFETQRAELAVAPRPTPAEHPVGPLQQPPVSLPQE
jgi:sulfotransferase famil protein